MIKRFKIPAYLKVDESTDGEFVLYEDALKALSLVLDAAIEAGADREKLEGMIDG